MKKIIFIIVCILILLLLFLTIYKLIPYTQKDLNRILDIYLEKTKPNMLDYYRLDMDKDGVIDVYDGALAFKKVGE